MSQFIRPNAKHRKKILESTKTEINLCYICGGCSGECPINIATNTLQPKKLVFMANLGMLDELVKMPEIWYCLQCKRCSQVCPMTVKPSDLIEYLRMESISCEVISIDNFLKYQELNAQLNKIRWYIAFQLINKTDIDSSCNWQQLLENCNKIKIEKISYNDDNVLNDSASIIQKSDSNSCYTCGECSSLCPAFAEEGIFDPRLIIRMLNLGFTDELIKSPSIWLCLSCKRCSDYCSQKVTGYDIMQDLQKLAIKKEIVDADFPIMLNEVFDKLYVKYLIEVDNLLGK